MRRTVLLLVLGLACAAPLRAEERTAALTPAIAAAELRAHVEHLASAALCGRETLSEECVQAAAYVAGQMEAAGLLPMGTDGSWFQGYAVAEPVLEEGNRLAVTTPEGTTAYAVERDWNPFSVSPRGAAEGPVVVAGYGIEASDREWDDYAGVDVRGKVVLVLRKNPGWREQHHASFVRKLEVAAAHGASALLLVNDPETTKAAGGEDRIGHWAAQVGAPAGAAKIPYAFVSQRVAAQILTAADRTLEGLEAALRESGPEPFAVPGVSVAIETALSRTTRENAQNVVGLLPGTDPEVADEVVVVGAHYDHLGRGRYGSLGGRAAAGQIHPGADDNASGTAALVELAAWFGVAENRLRRSVLFVAFSGEERGLLGSAHFVEHPTVRLADIVAMVNMDMVGRSRGGRLQVGGVGTARGLRELVHAQNAAHDLEITWDPQGLAPSDSTSFFRKRIPVLFFFTGLHEDYHRPSDTADKLNYPDLLRIALLARDVVAEIANRAERLEFTAPPPRKRPPVLGVQPAPQAHPDGLALARVVPGGPAAAAGLRDGDVIVELAGETIRDVQSLVGVLGALEAGKTVGVVVLRGTERVPLRVTLGERGGRRR